MAVFYNKYRDFIDENAITPGYTETDVPEQQHRARHHQGRRNSRVA